MQNRCFSPRKNIWPSLIAIGLWGWMLIERSFVHSDSWLEIILRRAAVEGLAEHEEALLALGREALAHALGEEPPELALDVLDRVDAEAVGVRALDPARVLLEHRVLDVAVGRVDVLEPAGEVAEEAAPEKPAEEAETK